MKKFILPLLWILAASALMSACSESSDNSNYNDGYSAGATAELKNAKAACANGCHQ